jgi:hypothetical protein
VLYSAHILRPEAPKGKYFLLLNVASMTANTPDLCQTNDQRGISRAEQDAPSTKKPVMIGNHGDWEL